MQASRQLGKQASKQASTRKAFSRSHALEGLVILYRNPKEEMNDGKVINEYFSSPSKALLKSVIISFEK